MNWEVRHKTSGSRDRGPGYYRGQLKRSVQRYRSGDINGELLAREVERFLHETERNR